MNSQSNAASKEHDDTLAECVKSKVKVDRLPSPSDIKTQLLASGLSAAVGFKNASDGSFTMATHSIKSAAHPHSFIGVSEQGDISVVRTEGNPNGHIVLRGGNGQPNFDALNVARCQHALRDSGLNPRIMVDCSHENSGKDHLKQPEVLKDIAEQVCAGNTSIMGVMLESHLNEGRQNIASDMVFQ
jgi:3-deoxy-7-phosphoheptulonate synthase